MVFNNRFNNKDKDPLVEAAMGAMKDGEMRRQAIAAVNEEFGVYNRNAVVREHLAAYDAAIEEAYKSLKEGKPPLSDKQKKMAAIAGDKNKIGADDLAALRAGAKIDEKKGCYEGLDIIDNKSGKVIGGSSFKPSDNDPSVQGSGDVTSGGKPSTPAQTTSAPQDAPTPPKRPANLQELKKPTPKTAMNAYYRAYDSDVRDGGEGKRTSRLGRWKEKHLPGKSARNQKDTGKAELDDYDRKTVKKSGVLTKASQKDTKAEIKSRLGKHTKPKHLPEEHLDEATKKHFIAHAADIAKISDQKERNAAATAAADTYARLNKRFDHAKFHKAAGSTAHETQTVKESVLAAVRAKYMKEDHE